MRCAHRRHSLMQSGHWVFGVLHGLLFALQDDQTIAIQHFVKAVAQRLEIQAIWRPLGRLIGLCRALVALPPACVLRAGPHRANKSLQLTVQCSEVCNTVHCLSLRFRDEVQRGVDLEPW